MPATYFLSIVLEMLLSLPRMGNGLVIIVSVVGGNSRCVSGDMTLGHKFNSFFLLSLLWLMPPRKRNDGEPLYTSICLRYSSMTNVNKMSFEARLALAHSTDSWLQSAAETAIVLFSLSHPLPCICLLRVLRHRLQVQGQ